MLLRSLTLVFCFYVRYLQSNTSMRPSNAAYTEGPKQIFHFLNFINKKKFVNSVSFTLFHFGSIDIFLYK